MLLLVFSLTQEFADAMMEVKRAVDEVKDSLTLKRILGCLLATGNFLNGKTVSNVVVCMLVHLSVCLYVCIYERMYVYHICVQLCVHVCYQMYDVSCSCVNVTV